MTAEIILAVLIVLCIVVVVMLFRFVNEIACEMDDIIDSVLEKEKENDEMIEELKSQIELMRMSNNIKS